MVWNFEFGELEIVCHLVLALYHAICSNPKPVIPAKVGIQIQKTGFLIKSGMTAGAGLGIWCLFFSLSFLVSMIDNPQAFQG